VLGVCKSLFITYSLVYQDQVNFSYACNAQAGEGGASLFTNSSKIDKIIPLLFGTAYDTKFTLLENL